MQRVVSESLASCRNLASTLIIVGIGDGTILQEIDADQQLRHKDVYALALGSEVFPDVAIPRLRRDHAGDFVGAQQWMFERFAAHEDIVRLGGCDIISDYPLSETNEKLRAELLPRIIAGFQDRPWALGNDINDTFMGLYHAALNAPSLLPAPSIGQLCGMVGQTPVISIGAGPSVREHLDNLRALQDRCILVACDAVYPALLQAGVVAHFVTPLERLRQQSSLVKSAAGLPTIFAGIPACHPDTVAPFGDRTIYLHAMDKLYDWLAPKEGIRCLAGSSTGVLSFLVAASFGRGPIFLVGHDLAKDEHGQTHFDGCDFAEKAQKEETAKSGSFGANGYETRLVPGNNGGMVESIMWWDTFRLEISTQARMVPGRIFNVNAHTGKYARIEHTIPAPLPNPDSLPRLPEIRMQHTERHRYDDWKSRAMLLPEDCDRFIEGMAAYREALRTVWNGPPASWKLDDLLNRMSPSLNVSPGNADAFNYFLRSAVFNEQLYTCHRIRTCQAREQAFWHTMQSLDGLADAMINAVRHVEPLLKEIAA